MDLRTEKTKKAILNAFITLRAKKPLEKITVKELADLAFINKATFYRHYEDIFALSESIEEELIQNCLDMFSEPDKLFDKDGVRNLADAFIAQGELFNIIFSGTRLDMAVRRIHDCLMNLFLKQHPEYGDDLEKKVLLTALIYGEFHSYLIYKDKDFDTVLNSLSKLNDILGE